MKKYIILGLALCALVISPVLAQTTQETIAQLQAMIVRLQAQIVELQRQRGIGGITPSDGSVWCYNFNKNLQSEMGEGDVAYLRNVLNKEGLGVSVSRPMDITIFDEATTNATIRFQEKYRSEILTPIGLTRGTGYVGPATRAVLNRLYGCKVINPNHAPII